MGSEPRPCRSWKASARSPGRGHGGGSNAWSYVKRCGRCLGGGPGVACHLLGPGSVMCAVWGRRMAARASNEPGPRGGGWEGPNRHGSWGGQALSAVGASGAPSVGGCAGRGSWAPRSRQHGTEVDLSPLAMRAEGWAFGAGTWDLFWACSFSRSQLVKGLNWRTKNFSVS